MSISSPSKNNRQPLAGPLIPTVPLEVPVVNPIGMLVPRPEFFRLPHRGGDPHFGLSRAWYYLAEKRGILKLIRLRDRGKLRGVTLVPYDEVVKLIKEAQGK